MSPLPFPPVELPHYIKQVREDAPSRILSQSSEGQQQTYYAWEQKQADQGLP